MKLLLLICCSLLCAFLTNAQTNDSATKSNSNTKRKVEVPPDKQKPIVVPRLDKPPVIDGHLNEDEWRQAVVLKDFYQTNPGDNTEPTKPTIVYIGYDSRFFYLAVHAYDDPDKVRATVAQRDRVFGEDNFRIFLDTFNDQRKAYLLGWNPLGVQADAIHTEGEGADFSVDIVMESKGILTSDGWTLEVAIPFKSLRYVAGKDKLWGFHLWRNIDRNNDEIDSWVPISRDISGTLTQEAHLTGLEGISTERTLEIIPSITFSETGKRVSALAAGAGSAALDPGRMLNEPIKADAGVSIKYGLTPTVTLDMAINPDFAQVEADQTVVTANQRFPIFFEEKRPFFLEGIDIFQTPLQAVHTRAIVDPDVAVKLTGKSGRNTFGVLLASDNAPGNFTDDERNDPLTFPLIQRFVDKNAYIGIFRLRRDVGKESTLGFLMTSYNFIEKHNQLAGIDGRFKLSAQKTFAFQVLGTTSRECFSDPKADLYTPLPSEPCYNGDETRESYRTGNGFSYSMRYNRDGRHFYYGANASGRTKDYRAEVGFTRRTNTNNAGFFTGYNSEPKPKAKVVQWNLNISGGINFDWQGRSQATNLESNIQFNFQRNSYFGFGAAVGSERLFEEEFGAARTTTQAGSFFGKPERSTPQWTPYLFTGTRFSKKYHAAFLLQYFQNSFDFDFGAGPKYPRVSPAALIDPDAPLDPGPGELWEANATFEYQPINALNTSIDYTFNKLTRNDTHLVAYKDNIISSRTTYQFTRFLFTRARVDYETLTSTARAQFLLGWTPNPGTAFYLGYNDDLTRNGFSPFTGQLEPGFRRNGRTFFVKFSYLIRKSFGGQ
ncbi:MAG TPA: DUF5916 domain-containing protein [Pyrinomonadaceae bacterium]|jgi:hypothetical protein|nr:DUF5916 domain-containing protein [Pyrinomonadaceae bacterium]